MSAADRADGKREPRLGLLSHQGRAAQARAHGGRDHTSVRAGAGWHSTLRSPSQAELEAVPGGSSPDPGGGRLPQRRHRLRLYVLIYMHLTTRRVLLAACTANPNEAWMAQQARNLAWMLEEEGIKLKAVVHDRDKKFSARADNILRPAGVRVILTPLMAPRANAHVERWIGSCRRECLDRMLVVNQRHLEAILGEYCTHYNQERPHRSRELRPPAARGDPAVARTRGVRRRVRLGGLISEYYREAVAA